jgi:hypothetical protein
LEKWEILRLWNSKSHKWNSFVWFCFNFSIL